MEAIAAHMQFGIHGVWQRVDIGFRRQAGHAEFRIENRHIGHTGKSFFADPPMPMRLAGIMRGPSRKLSLMTRSDALIHEDGCVISSPRVQHAMAYAVDFLLVLDHADLRINQQRNDQFHGLDMGWEILVAHNFLLLVGIGHDLCASSLPFFQANAFGKAGAENCFVAHVDELIFAGGRAGIDYKYLHDILFLYCFYFAFVGRGLDGRNGDSVDDISGTRQPRERSFTGLFRPWSTGPMVLPGPPSARPCKYCCPY